MIPSFRESKYGILGPIFHSGNIFGQPVYNDFFKKAHCVIYHLTQKFLRNRCIYKLNNFEFNTIFLYGLIQSFVLVGRPYFHKNKKYEFACQLTEAIIKERTMPWKNKNRLICIALSTNTKIRANRKWKLREIQMLLRPAGEKLNFWFMLRVVQLKKTDFDPVSFDIDEEIPVPYGGLDHSVYHMHYSTGPGNFFLKLLQVLKNGMLQEKMGKNLVTNYPIFGPVELPPI